MADVARGALVDTDIGDMTYSKTLEKQTQIFFYIVIYAFISSEKQYLHKVWSNIHLVKLTITCLFKIEMTHNMLFWGWMMLHDHYQRTLRIWSFYSIQSVLLWAWMRLTLNNKSRKSQKGLKHPRKEGKCINFAKKKQKFLLFPENSHACMGLYGWLPFWILTKWKLSDAPLELFSPHPKSKLHIFLKTELNSTAILKECLVNTWCRKWQTAGGTPIPPHR